MTYKWKRKRVDLLFLCEIFSLSFTSALFISLSLSVCTIRNHKYVSLSVIQNSPDSNICSVNFIFFVCIYKICKKLGKQMIPFLLFEGTELLLLNSVWSWWGWIKYIILVNLCDVICKLLSRIDLTLDFNLSKQANIHRNNGWIYLLWRGELGPPR